MVGVIANRSHRPSVPVMRAGKHGIDQLTINDGFPAPIVTKQSAWSDSDSQVGNGTLESGSGNSSPFHFQNGNGTRSSKRGPVEGRSPRFSCDYYAGDSEEDLGDEDSEKAERRRRFKEARKVHYNMREALQA